MKNNKKKIAVSVVAAILLVLLYLLIFAFSGQDGEESGSLSSMISEKCAELLNAISGKHWTQNVIDSMAAYFEHPIRKLAHFSEYACMGMLLYGVWRPWKERNRKLYLLIVLWVFVSAGADEFHQLFVPGRYGCFADVVLDTCGGAFGLLVCVCVEKIVRRVSTSCCADCSPFRKGSLWISRWLLPDRIQCAECRLRTLGYGRCRCF